MADHYEVNAHWEGDSGYWVAVIEPRGWATQARTVAGLEERVAEAIELMAGERPDHVAITLIGLEAADELRARREALQAQRSALDAEIARLQDDTAKFVRRVHEDGVSFRDAGHLVGLSHQRIQQIVKQPA